jgi:hypothetical protein
MITHKQLKCIELYQPTNGKILMMTPKKVEMHY